MTSSAASKFYRFLNSIQVRQLYLSYIANGAPTQPGLLDSAVTSPVNVKCYGSQDNLFQLAASLSEKIMKNHAFQDGNKRTIVRSSISSCQGKSLGVTAKRLPLQSRNGPRRFSAIVMMLPSIDENVKGYPFRYYHLISLSASCTCLKLSTRLL
jgi:hypothetical protein